MDPKLLALLACPKSECRGGLDARRVERDRRGALRDGELVCKRCKTAFPVLSGIPVLVPDPDGWMAAFREAVVATLAESGRLRRRTLEVIRGAVERAPETQPMRFADDWDRPEARAAEPFLPVSGPDAGVRAFRRFITTYREADLATQLLGLLPEGNVGAVLEIGPGAGTLASRISSRTSRLLLGDLSLRAVLLATERVKRSRASGAVGGVVLEAEHLPVRAGRLRTLVAANVVDLVARPGAFAQEAARVLARRGRVLASTPAPALGHPSLDETTTAHLFEAARLRRVAVVDALPWVRTHGPRHYEVYLVQALLFERS